MSKDNFDDEIYGIKTLVYGNGKEIPSIVMGSGNVGVMSFGLNNEGFVGITFDSAGNNNIVGDRLETKDKDLEFNKIEAQLLFDKVESINVVIGALNRAKVSLINKGWVNVGTAGHVDHDDS